MYVIRNRKYFYAFSGLLAVACFVLMGVWGFKIGADFTGGTIIEVSYPEGAPTQEVLEAAIVNSGIEEVSVRVAGENGFIIRTRPLSVEEASEIKQTLALQGRQYLLERFNSVGPLIGKELRNRAVIAIGVIVVITVLFIAFAFRQISKPVSSWIYGLVAIVTLIHDITIPTALAVILGRFSNMTVDALFVTALLSLLGYSVNDTIIIFDRIRDNLKNNLDKNIHESFEDTVGKSLSQTYGRSINTSITTLLVLIALYLFGGSSIHYFILTLVIGCTAGIYSSIFLAAPLLVTINNWKMKK